ncbi:MAG: hypothetical protein ABJ242_07450 [Marinomonas sp.]
MAYSDEDLNSAVAAGVMSQEAAAALRSHVSQLRDMPRGDEENFRLINSFNDIFVAIGVVILLVAVGAIGQAIAGAFIGADAYREAASPNFSVSDPATKAWQDASQLEASLAFALSGLFVTATAWSLAEFFTRKRRMALPSIILLLAFVCGSFSAAIGLGMTLMQNGNDQLGAIIGAFAAAFAAGAAYLHWKRFAVPITVAAGAAAVAGTLISLAVAALGPDNFSEDAVLGLVFVAGLCVFAFAMRWDMSDVSRTTRRADVAFWLHLLAAPMIAHPVFNAMGVLDAGDSVGIGGAFAVVAIYILFGLIALAIDRRALLVSALAYVLVALTFLFDKFGAVELNFALTALVIGSALLSLSAFWSPIRAVVVGVLPQNLQTKLPAAGESSQSAMASA